MPVTLIQRRPVAPRRRLNSFSTLSRAGVVLIIMTLSAPALAGSTLPRGFVYLRDRDPTIVQDIRYAGSHNFVGRPITGYLAAECILSVSAANALGTVQRMLTEKSLSLIVWDCYRPKRAVDDFLERVAFPLRAEKAILDAVKRCAVADLRSVNAEIEMLLREALARRGIRIKPTNEDG